MLFSFLPGVGVTFCGVGSSRKAGGGGRFSRLPMEDAEFVVLVMEAVLRIGGGGLLACTDPRRSSVERIVPLVYTATILINRTMNIFFVTEYLTA